MVELRDIIPNRRKRRSTDSSAMQSLRQHRGHLQVYLNAGFGEPLGEETHREIDRLHFTGIRQDIPDDHDAAYAVIEDMLHSNGHPIFLIGGGKMRRHHPAPGGPEWPEDDFTDHVIDTLEKLESTGWLNRPFSIEIGNEPDISKTRYADPKHFASLVTRAASVCDELHPETRVITGGVSNLHRDGITFIRGYANAIPAHVHIGIHRYPVALDESEPHFGATRWSENTALKNVIGERPFWVTETGRSRWHEERFLWIRRTRAVSEATVKRHLRAELEFWKRARAQAVTIYQHRDGPKRRFLDGFGLADVDGKWYPWTEELKNWIHDARFNREGA